LIGPASSASESTRIAPEGIRAHRRAEIAIAHDGREHEEELLHMRRALHIVRVDQVAIGRGVVLEVTQRHVERPHLAHIVVGTPARNNTGEQAREALKGPPEIVAPQNRAVVIVEKELSTSILANGREEGTRFNAQGERREGEREAVQQLPYYARDKQRQSDN
jgi:hypothetical protein